MKGILVATAVAAAIAVAFPAIAQAPATNPSPQTGAAPITAPEQPGGGERADNGEMRGRGGWAMRGGAMMHREMWHRGMMRQDPQQRCIDRLAWRAARRAYVETELNLTPEQRPLWDKLQNIAHGEQQKERQLCNQLKPDTELTMLDRLDRAQRFLSARLDALQTAKPAVQALYQALSAEQKEIFDHPFRRD